MNCSDFQQLIAERVAGELTSEQRRETDAHEQVCPACRRAVEEWKQMGSLLRASWPPEDPRRPFFLPNPQRHSGWLETARTWFGLASMATVSACLLLLVILRPSVSFDRSQLSLRFTHTSTEAGALSANAVTQAEVQALVQQALEQAASQGALKMQPAFGLSAIPSSEEGARRVAQIAVQLEMLRENQASLWQQVEQHGLYLQSAWRNPMDQSDIRQNQRSDRP